MNVPVVPLIADPAGLPASSENVSVCPASGSVAVAVNASVASSFTVLFPTAPSTGGWFGAGLTVIVIASKSLSAGDPLSVARTVTGNVPLAPGVHEKAPVDALIVAPAGAPASSEKLSVLAGTSGSVAVAVKVIATPTVPALFPMTPRTGPELTSLTVTVIEAVPLRPGVPPSVARTVTG